jgi:predicted DNA binding CopG/RHH family protein
MLSNSKEGIMKDKQTNIRLPEDIKNQIKDKADSVGMTISEYIRFLIINDLKNK